MFRRKKGVFPVVMTNPGCGLSGASRVIASAKRDRRHAMEGPKTRRLQKEGRLETDWTTLRVSIDMSASVEDIHACFEMGQQSCGAPAQNFGE